MSTTPTTSSAPKAPLQISAAYKAMESYNPTNESELKKEWNSFKTNYAQSAPTTTSTTMPSPTVATASTTQAPKAPLQISAAYKAMDSYKPKNGSELKKEWNSFKTNYAEASK